LRVKGGAGISEDEKTELSIWQETKNGSFWLDLVPGLEIQMKLLKRLQLPSGIDPAVNTLVLGNAASHLSEMIFQRNVFCYVGNLL